MNTPEEIQFIAANRPAVSSYPLTAKTQARARLVGVAAESTPGQNAWVGTIISRHGPRRRLVTAVASLGTATALVVGTITAVTLAREPSAQAQVASAVEHTIGQSFHVTTTTLGSGGTPVRAVGAFDPAQHVGRVVVSEPIGTTEIRYVGDLEYSKVSDANYMHLPPSQWRAQRTRKPWTVSPRPHEGSLWSTTGEAGPITFVQQDPQTALKDLQSAGGWRDKGTTSGSGWTGHRYGFAGEQHNGTRRQAINGTIDVDTRNRVRRVQLTLPEGNGDWLRGVMDFSSYGAPVSVRAPSADQVQQLVPLPLPRAGASSDPRTWPTITVSPPHATAPIKPRTPTPTTTP